MKILKNLLLLLFVVNLTSCKHTPSKYYMTHPNKLQKEIDKCNLNVINTAYCQNIYSIAQKIGELTYELQSNPQDFGQKITYLQQKDITAKEEEELKMRLAILGWLTAPRN